MSKGCRVSPGRSRCRRDYPLSRTLSASESHRFPVSVQRVIGASQSSTEERVVAREELTSRASLSSGKALLAAEVRLLVVGVVVGSSGIRGDLLGVPRPSSLAASIRTEIISPSPDYCSRYIPLRISSPSSALRKIEIPPLAS